MPFTVRPSCEKETGPEVTKVGDQASRPSKGRKSKVVDARFMAATGGLANWKVTLGTMIK